MLQEIIKDITTVDSGVILHGCNTSGIAYASGVAGAIRKKWPHAYKRYTENGGGEHLLGTVMCIKHNKYPNLVIINGYTQIKYGRDGKRYADINAVEKCILYACATAQNEGLPLYMPMIGCGLGGLSWEDEIRAVVENASYNFPEVNIVICDL